MANEEPNKQEPSDNYLKMREIVKKMYAPNTDPDTARLAREFNCRFTHEPDPDLPLDELLKNTT